MVKKRDMRINIAFAKAFNVEDVDKKNRSPKAFKRQKTVGWRNQQTRTNRNNLQYRRSPTNKSGTTRARRQEKHESVEYKTKFLIRTADGRVSEDPRYRHRNYDKKSNCRSKHKPKHGVSIGSKHSSLNYISDAKIDQLSMNFAIKQGGFKQKNNENNMFETVSIISSISKPVVCSKDNLQDAP